MFPPNTPARRAALIARNRARAKPKPWWECPACSVANDGDRERCVKCGASRHASGQALVEFILLLPVLLLLLLATFEVGNISATKGRQDRMTSVIAIYAAGRPNDGSWSAVAAQELPGCVVTVDFNPPGPPGVLEAGSTCPYNPIALHGFFEVPISSSESAAIATTAP